MRWLFIFTLILLIKSNVSAESIYVSDCKDFMGNLGQCYYLKESIFYPTQKKKLFMSVKDKSYVRVWIKQEVNNSTIMMLNTYSCKDRSLIMEDCKKDDNECTYPTEGGVKGALAWMKIVNRNIIPGSFDDKMLKLLCR